MSRRSLIPYVFIGGVTLSLAFVASAGAMSSLLKSEALDDDVPQIPSYQERPEYPVPEAGASWDDAFDENGLMDPAKVPELIPTANREGEFVGYVRREQLFPGHYGGEARVDGSHEIIDLDGNVVGYMVPAKGYFERYEYERGDHHEVEPVPVTVVELD